MVVPQEIYEFVLAQGEPAVLPGAWRGLSCHEGFVDLRVAQATLLERLQTTFPQDALLAAKVVMVDDQNQARLSPLLSGPAAAFTLGLQQQAQRNPVDLLVDGQTISQTRPGWGAVLDDFRLGNMLPTGGSEILVAFTQPDVALLWTLGYPAIPGNGLDHLGGNNLTAFCKKLNWREPTLSNTAASAECVLPDGPPLSLILVNWLPAQLDAADVPSAQQVAEHFCKLQRYLGMEADNCCVWKPQPAELEGIRFSQQFGTLEQLQSAVEANMDDFSVALDGQAQDCRSYSETVLQWLSLPEDRMGWMFKKEAWDCIQEQQRIKLIEPLLKRAEASQDPVERNLLELFANICRLLHPQMLAMSGKFRESIQRSGVSTALSLPKDELQLMFSLADQVRGIARELKPSRKKRK